MKKKNFLAPYLIWILVFTIIPLSTIAYYGIRIQDYNGNVGFSLENIGKVFSSIYIQTIIRSINYALISTIICFVLAYPLALIIVKRKTNKATLIFIFVLPMWMNFLLRTYAWMSLLETNNGFINTALRFFGLPTISIINTPAAVILGMVYNFLPFMILPIYNSLIQIERSVLEAASDLGAKPFKRFIRIIFPLTIPGIMSGIAMVFMPAVTTFVIPNLLGGGKITLIGNMIEQQFMQTYNWYLGSSMSLVLMVGILMVMAIVNRMESQDKAVSLW